MRRIIFTKALLLFWGFVSAQCITNGTLNSTCSGNGFNATANCVNGWRASHGTPSVYGTVGGNTWAWLWSHSNTGEGILTNYNFQQGRTYQVSFNVRATTNINNPNATVMSSTLNVRAASGISGGDSVSIPTTSGSQNIWSSTMTNAGNGWNTINVSFTPTSNHTQLWIYPLMAANSINNGSAQIQMEVDNVVITPPVTSVFHFQDSGGVARTDFCIGENIYMNGTDSFGESHYYIDVWRRPNGSTSAFQWQAQLGTTGWTTGQAGVLNLSALFGAQNYTFSNGFEYQVKLATACSPCVGWIESSKTFRILNNTASAAFTTTRFCAPNGTISVTATATDTTPGLVQWWGLFETNAQGAVDDPATIGQVGAIQNGTTATFTGLTNNRNYYIKHGVHQRCVFWTEERIALPQSVSWPDYTTDFDLAPSANLNGTVTVIAVAHNNPVFVNHHWSIFDAPNGSTLGNTPVPGNPDQCCSSASATFSANMVVNQWYYIKHAIWNNCSGWNETRRAFRVIIEGRLADGSPDYAVEEYIKEDKIKIKQAISSDNEAIVLYPNPVALGEKLYFSAEEHEVTEAHLIDFAGISRKLDFTGANSKTIVISLNNRYKPGVYTLKVTCKEGFVIIRKLIIK